MSPGSTLLSGPASHHPLPLSSNRICPGSSSLSVSLSRCLYVSHPTSPSLIVPSSESQFPVCQHFPPPRCPHPFSVFCILFLRLHISNSTSLTPCLFLCLFPGFAVYRSLTLRASVSLPSLWNPTLPLGAPTLLAPGWRGGVRWGALRWSCVFPAQNRLLLPWRRERGLGNATLQDGG